MTALLLSLVISLFVSAVAFPNGAGGCAGGQAAVGGAHLARPVTNTGPLASFGGLVLTIDGVAVEDGGSIAIEAEADYEVRVESTLEPFRGILMRLQAPDGVDTTSTLIPAEFTQVANVCASPVVGVTHFNNDDKSFASGTMRFDEAVDGAVTLDVTVVVANNAEISEYYYSGFTVNVLPATANLPTAAPPTTSSPTAPPIAAPTAVPIPVTPTTAPITASPTQAVGSDTPSDIPTSVPTGVMSDMPSDIPSVLYGTVAPTPVEVGACSAEAIQFETCLNSTLTPEEVATCDECVVGLVPALGSSCNQYQTGICAALEWKCSCGTCGSDIEAYFDCQLREAGVADCTLQCGDCDEARVDMEACFSDSGGANGEECLSCVAGYAAADSEVDFSSCVQINAALCPAIRNLCNCDPCRKRVEEYMSCQYSKDPLPCQIACDVPEDPTPAPSGTGDNGSSGAVERTLYVALAIAAAGMLVF